MATRAPSFFSRVQMSRARSMSDTSVVSVSSNSSEPAGKPGGVQRVDDRLAEVAVELRHRHVHAQRERLRRQRVASEARRTRLPKRPLAERHDEARLFGDGMNCAGRHRAAVRQCPAHQRFDAAHAAAARIELRLVVHLQAAVLERARAGPFLIFRRATAICAVLPVARSKLSCARVFALRRAALAFASSCSGVLPS